ncbi:MAG: hydantoinase/oxoprolinase family protein [Alphaproteobacteria bacterium]|nr:hydantoinase/oxoprolinase family protein [Alphaproteobacteria bacterium]
MDSQCRVAVDIGGTFTDIVLLSDDGRAATRKVPSTPGNYADGVIDGVTRLLTDLGRASESVVDLLHACTVATNAILEHKGARTALITTKGFRDILTMRRIRVPRLYDPMFVKPEPLVPRNLCLEVEERLDHKGQVIRPLSRPDVHTAIARICAADVQAVAVMFLHSYANPAHEREVGAMLAEALPDHFISLSVDVLPELREYERASTTVINAYVGPPVKSYLDSLRAQLSRAGIPARLQVMLSSGGILDCQAVTRWPAQIVESGPAAGVIGAARLGRLAGYQNLITLDMGGTTAKASIIENSQISMTDEYEVGGAVSLSAELTKGGGYPLRIPAIDISEVGAGGGSLVWLDPAKAIKVGPASAGAVPGPACYDTGNDEPTVTDANVVLGYLNQSALAGGTVPLRPERSYRAIETKIAAPLGRGLMETAYGVHTIADANMMHAVKTVTTYRGRDPRDFDLFAFGGNGGVHAVSLARLLQIRRVLIPPAAGVFSAVGLLFANVEATATQAILAKTAELSLTRLEQGYRQLELRVAELMGYPADHVRYVRLMDMRYGGQASELVVAVPAGPITADALKAVEDRFELEHERRRGHRLTGNYGFELVNLRVRGVVDSTGASARPGPAAFTGTASGKAEAVRAAYFGPTIGALKTPVLPGRHGLQGAARAGPLIVEDYDGTTVVPPDCHARLDAIGNIVIDLGGAP